MAATNNNNSAVPARPITPPKTNLCHDSRAPATFSVRDNRESFSPDVETELDAPSRAVLRTWQEYFF